MHIVNTTAGASFDVETDETLLDASVRSTVCLAYSCKTGRCGTCKGKLLAGRTAVLLPEVGLSQSESDAGWILTCARTCLSDISLEIDQIDQSLVFPVGTFPCRISSIEFLTEDILIVVLRLPPSTVFGFCPGQYIDVIGGWGVRRSYSIANAPQSDNNLELHIRRVMHGEMSTYWFTKAKVGDLLRLRGPLGTFYLRDVAGLDLVFLATGTGIAPVKAMLEGLRDQPVGTPRSVRVFWGGREVQDMYWTGGCDVDNYHMVQVLSRANESWTGARGHVQQQYLMSSPDLGRTIVYACGSDLMIHDARRLLLNAGLPSDRFYSDAFVCSAPV